VGCGALGGVVVSSASGPGSDGAHQGVVGGREEALDVSANSSCESLMEQCRERRKGVEQSVS
jgi:hypothetical protein